MRRVDLHAAGLRQVGVVVTARKLGACRPGLVIAAFGLGAPTRDVWVKMIEAMILPHELEAVKEALAGIQIFGLTVVDVQGTGGGGASPQGQGKGSGIQRKLKVMLAVGDEQVQPALEALQKGRGPDAPAGGVYVAPLEDVVRIRTGERGHEAL